MTINISGVDSINSTYSSGGVSAHGATGGGGLSNKRLLEMLTKIIEKKDQKVESTLQTAVKEDDKTAMLRATSAQGEQQAAFTAASGIVKGNNENMQAAARRN